MLVQIFPAPITNYHLKWNFNPKTLWLVKLTLQCHGFLLLSLEIWQKLVLSLLVTRSYFATFPSIPCYYTSCTKTLGIKVQYVVAASDIRIATFLFSCSVRKQKIGKNKPFASQKTALLASTSSLPTESCISLFVHQRERGYQRSSFG